MLNATFSVNFKHCDMTVNKVLSDTKLFFAHWPIFLIKQKTKDWKMTVKRTHSSTVFEDDRKSLIQHCERSKLSLHFEWTKVNQKYQMIKWSNSVTRHVSFDKTKIGEKCQKSSIFARFLKLEFPVKQCYQTGHF